MSVTLLEQLLDYYQISKEEYEELIKPSSLDDFALSHDYITGKQAASLFKQCIDNNLKTIIYGDYDADGIMGTSILINLCNKLGFHSDYYIPNRYIDGYGININKAKEYVESGYELVITVDNGISAFEAIDYLKNHNVKVIVLDHHEQQNNSLPNADIIMHPIISKFGDIPSSGAFTAFFFSYYVLGYFDKYLSTLASISLITDMMPLKGYNRNLLKAVIANYKKGEYLNIDLLLEGNNFSDNAIGMQIGPKINAIGRLIEDTSINEIVKYFVSQDKEYILNYFEYIKSINDKRKLLTQEFLKNIEITDEKYVIKVYDDVKEGLIGLIAGHVTNKYRIPCIILTSEDGKIYKGSSRAPEGYNLFDAFNELKDLFITFGGHAQAGGLSISKDNLPLFISRFEEYYAKHPFKAVEKKYINLTLNDINMDNYKLINSFSPFGEAWKAPNLKIKHIKTAALKYTKNLTAVRTVIGYNAILLGFNMNPSTFKDISFIDISGSLRTNTFNGITSVEFLIDDFEKSDI